MPDEIRGYFTMDDFDLTDKTVILRLDINSPIHPVTGEIMGDSRFRSHISTLDRLKNSKVVILAHQSRPGKSDYISLEGHAKRMERIIGRRVRFCDSLFGPSAIQEIKKMNKGDILMLENTRFFSEDVVLDSVDNESMEESNLVRGLSSVADFFINDAFPAIHRGQTSLTGFTNKIPNIAGLLIQTETEAIERFLKSDKKKSIAILAGAKIEDSISVARSFQMRNIVSKVLVGGVVANAFLWATGKKIGRKNEDFIKHNNRNYEAYLKICKDIVDQGKNFIITPTDFILNPSQRRIEKNEEVPDDQIIADIGPDTIAKFSKEIKNAGNIFVNGPMGMYEISEYSTGTYEILREISNSGAVTLAGGGHTISALEILGLTHKIDHISTGGGALISYLSGEPMPVLEALKKSRQKFQEVK